jgi:hypothetical protein
LSLLPALPMNLVSSKQWRSNKYFLDNQKLREFIVRRPELQEILKEVFPSRNNIK